MDVALMAEKAVNAESSGSKDLRALPQQPECQANEDDHDDSSRIECAVCLQVCIHPVQLPCGHIFCFLCVKGVANQSKRCAMCRKELPADYLDRPNLVGGVDVFNGESTAFDDGTQWFYEGHNGWWQYDERTSAELEAAFKSGKSDCELLIAGFLYVIDFQAMMQFRRNDLSRRRHIKRDLVSIPKKGIAGLRVTQYQLAPQNNGEDDESGETGDYQVAASSSTEQALSEPVLASRPATNSTTSTRMMNPSCITVRSNNRPQAPHTSIQDSDALSPVTPPSSLHNIVQDMENLLLLDSTDENDDVSLLNYSTIPDLLD